MNPNTNYQIELFTDCFFFFIVMSRIKLLFGIHIKVFDK